MQTEYIAFNIFKVWFYYIANVFNVINKPAYLIKYKIFIALQKWLGKRYDLILEHYPTKTNITDTMSSNWKDQDIKNDIDNIYLLYTDIISTLKISDLCRPVANELWYITDYRIINSIDNMNVSVSVYKQIADNKIYIEWTDYNNKEKVFSFTCAISSIVENKSISGPKVRLITSAISKVSTLYKKGVIEI